MTFINKPVNNQYWPFQCVNWDEHSIIASFYSAFKMAWVWKVSRVFVFLVTLSTVRMQYVSNMLYIVSIWGVDETRRCTRTCWCFCNVTCIVQVCNRFACTFQTDFMFFTFLYAFNIDSANMSLAFHCIYCMLSRHIQWCKQVVYIFEWHLFGSFWLLSWIILCIVIGEGQ